MLWSNPVSLCWCIIEFTQVQHNDAAYIEAFLLWSHWEFAGFNISKAAFYPLLNTKPRESHFTGTLLISRSLFLKQCHCSLPPLLHLAWFSWNLQLAIQEHFTIANTTQDPGCIKWVGKLLGSIGHPKKHHRGKITSPVPTHMSPCQAQIPSASIIIG